MERSYLLVIALGSVSDIQLEGEPHLRGKKSGDRDDSAPAAANTIHPNRLHFLDFFIPATPDDPTESK